MAAAAAAVVVVGTAPGVPLCRCCWDLARMNGTVLISMWAGKGGKHSSFDDRPGSSCRRCYWALGSGCGEVEAGSGANAGMRWCDGRAFQCRLTSYGAR